MRAMALCALIKSASAMSDPTLLLADLEQVLRAAAPLAVAVSGGVDSMTLAVVAHRACPGRVRMVHAVSAAVPAQATARVRRHASREGWDLRVVDAGEFADPRYRDNPADRCFYCKSSLYATMARLCSETLVSGTNCDDLGDYRPGLRAAVQHQVRHPFVEVGIDKACVRAIARALELDDLAELPAAPCLSSRIETGIAIDPRVLPVVNAVERLIGDSLSPRTVRCRVRHDGVVIELDEASLQTLAGDGRDALAADVARRFAAIGELRPVSFAPYRMGSAFLRPA